MVMMVGPGVGDRRNPLAAPDSFSHPIHDRFHAVTVQHRSKECRCFTPEFGSVVFHNGEVCSYEWREIYLVHYEQLRAGNTGPAFTRDLIPTSNVHDVDGGVYELRTEGGGQVVAPTLYKEQI